MRKDIYSKINVEKLLHTIYHLDVMDGRLDITDPNKYIQVGIMSFNSGKKFAPHRHITLLRNTDITQESFIVIKGKIKAILYDLDNKLLHEEELCAGDCFITFEGGHTLEFLEENTVVYEAKTGPYYGTDVDKIKI